jgi:hypothetical protein
MSLVVQEVNGGLSPSLHHVYMHPREAAHSDRSPSDFLFLNSSALVDPGWQWHTKLGGRVTWPCCCLRRRPWQFRSLRKPHFKPTKPPHLSSSSILSPSPPPAILLFHSPALRHSGHHGHAEIARHPPRRGSPRARPLARYVRVPRRITVLLTSIR